jgi:hypothetical protein
MKIITTVNGKRIRLRHRKPGSKPLPADVKKRRVNICLSSHWHEVGKEKAAARKLSFSGYLEELIYRDSLHNESG